MIPLLLASHVAKDKDAVPDKTRKKISAEPSDAKSKLEQRQFYHSQTFQMRSHLQKLDGEILGKDQAHFMHLWNSIVRQQRVVADGHIPWACEAFARLHKKELKMNSSLFWCWKLFVVKLWDERLVDGSTIRKCTGIIENKETTENFESAHVPTAPTTISEKNTNKPLPPLDLEAADESNVGKNKETTENLESAPVPTAPTTVSEKNSIPPPPLDLNATVESTVSKNGDKAEMDVEVDQSALSEQRKVAADTEASQDAEMDASTSESTQKFV